MLSVAHTRHVAKIPELLHDLLVVRATLEPCRLHIRLVFDFSQHRHVDLEASESANSGRQGVSTVNGHERDAVLVGISDLVTIC